MPTKMTYKELKESVLKQLIDQKQKKKAIQNHLSAFNSFITVLNLNENEEALAFENYDSFLPIYFSKISLSSGTIAGRKSQLQKFSRMYQKINLNVQMPPNFSERLNFLLKRDGRAYHKIARICKINGNTLRGWKIGKLPSKDFIPAIRRLEKEINVEEGTLFNTIKHVKGQKKEMNSNINQTDYGKRLRINHKEPYLFKFANWPAKLKQQWLTLEKHFTREIPPKKPRHPKSLWGPETTSKMLSNVESFFGFLILDKANDNPRLRGLGFHESELDITMTVDDELIEKYVEFRKERTKIDESKGAYSNGIRDALTCFKAFVHPKHGIFRHYDEFKERISNQGLLLNDYCDASHKRLLEIIIQTPWAVTRDPKARIRPFLSSDNPKQYLKLLLEKMKQDNLIDPSETRIRKQALSHFCTYFLCAFLFANPLRINMFSKMKFDKNLVFVPSNGGKSLYHCVTGDWQLRFKSVDFKNTKHTAKHDYDVRVAAWLAPAIEEYIDIYRPLTTGAATCSYVFRPCVKVPPGYSENKPMKPSSLSRWVDQGTKSYLGGFGFRAHAFRHIIAYDYIKNHPNGFQVVASILHDSLQTVLKYYGNLKQCEWFENYNYYTEKYMQTNLDTDDNEGDQ
jgi:hypothetical protein